MFLHKIQQFGKSVGITDIQVRSGPLSGMGQKQKFSENAGNDRFRGQTVLYFGKVGEPTFSQR